MTAGGPHTAKIEELRRQLGLIQQTIAALEILNGDRPMPAAAGESYTATRDQPAPRRLLAPARTTARRVAKKKPKPKPVDEPRPRALALRPDNELEEAAVLEAVRKIGSATCQQVVAATKLPELRVKRAKSRLEKRGQIITTGWSRGARWSLPSSAKEVP